MRHAGCVTGFNADADMRRELMRRMSDGWGLEGARTRDTMIMTRVVSPPVWRVAVEFLNPIAWFLGPSWPIIVRTLVVSMGDDGELHRRTTGEIPRGWPQSHAWDVPDGPIADHRR